MVFFFPIFDFWFLVFGSACTSSCTQSKGRHSRPRTRARPACLHTGSRWTMGCSSRPRASSSPSRLLSCKCPTKHNAQLSAAIVGWSSASRRETRRVEYVVLKLDIWRSNLVKAFPTSTHLLLFVHPYSLSFRFIQGLSIFHRCSSCWLHSCFSCPY